MNQFESTINITYLVILCGCLVAPIYVFALLSLLDIYKSRLEKKKVNSLEEQRQEAAQETKVLLSVQKIIQEVSEDICDNYCKYRETADEDNLCDPLRNGSSCPLDRLQ